MNCPFCNKRLQIWKYLQFTTYSCEFKKCLNDDMARYQVSYNNYPTYIISKTLMIDKYYVQIDYKNNKTVLSILIKCFLIDSLEINNILDFNKNKKDDFLNKIKMLSVLS